MADYYKLYTDKQTLFECKVELEGASLKNAVPRLVLEMDSQALLFEGEISNAGKCEIPVSKLRGIVDEDVTGNMALEIIVEDAYFQPWSQKFKVVPSKRLRVEVSQPKEEKKSAMVVEVVDPSEKRMRMLTREIVKSLRKKGINATNVMTPKKKAYATKFIKEAAERYNGNLDTHILITNVVNHLAE